MSPPDRSCLEERLGGCCALTHRLGGKHREQAGDQSLGDGACCLLPVLILSRILRAIGVKLQSRGTLTPRLAAYLEAEPGSALTERVPASPEHCARAPGAVISRVFLSSCTAQVSFFLASEQPGSSLLERAGSVPLVRDGAFISNSAWP